ncbi:SRPBCC family protein [Microbacterium sulfonylureivorans]|uniref:SRPBCC family protein n=1 Tax=Microbacterium sulfonylureivorans TaxID=2486854 RepID=UPI000FD8EA7D|nr:SRPBCC domain-containing protein [Microbacterium sulfonylureivorans]
MSANFSTTITAAATPQQAFDAVCDVAGWWGRITGTTGAVGDEFVYVVPGLHYSGFRVTALEPGRLVEWTVTGSYLDFVDSAQEWNGTTVRFEISGTPDGVAVAFTHDGLTDEDECYEICSNAWSSFVNGSLKAFIETGDGMPYEFGGAEALGADDHEALHRGVVDALAADRP